MAPKYILEQFLQQELLINITEHEVYIVIFNIITTLFVYEITIIFDIIFACSLSLNT